jgi:hypothetical protein
MVAKEGKLLRRKGSDAAFEDITLGFDYYDTGVPLATRQLQGVENYEVIDRPEDWEDVGAKVDQSKRLEKITQILNEEKREFKNRGLTPEQMIKHQRFAPAWGEDIKEGDTVVKGEKFTYEGKLYAVLQDHTILPHYYPSINTAALYVEVTPDYTEEGEEYGTLENPIAYNGNMVLENGKYYEQEGVVYLCSRDTGVPVYNALKDLVNIYVEVAK